MREQGKSAEAEARGRLVLTLSVLVILLTAPVGALSISILGPRWLSREVAPLPVPPPVAKGGSGEEGQCGASDGAPGRSTADGSGKRVDPAADRGTDKDVRSIAVTASTASRM